MKRNDESFGLEDNGSLIRASEIVATVPGTGLDVVSKPRELIYPGV